MPNFDSRTQRDQTFFDLTVFFYGWKNSEPDASKDFKISSTDLRSFMQSGFTQGSIIYADSNGELTEDNTNLYYDDINAEFGFNISSGLISSFNVRTPGNDALSIYNSGNSEVIRFYASGQMDFGGVTGGAIGRLNGTQLQLRNNSGSVLLYNRGDGANSDLILRSGGNSPVFTNMIFESGGLGGTEIARFTPNFNLRMQNAVSADTGAADSFLMYGADVAGNSVPHFKTENNDVVRIYALGGWGAPTGTADRTTFDTTTVPLQELAERVKAIIDDLTTLGFFKA